MTKLPRIVAQRLAGWSPPSDHPDADLLTAFSERRLAPDERERVLEHLSTCTECREIMALALPENATSQPLLIPERAWRPVWALRFGAAAAALAMIAIGVTMVNPLRRVSTPVELSGRVALSKSEVPSPALEADADAKQRRVTASADAKASNRKAVRPGDRRDFSDKAMIAAESPRSAKADHGSNASAGKTKGVQNYSVVAEGKDRDLREAQSATSGVAGDVASGLDRGHAIVAEDTRELKAIRQPAAPAISDATNEASSEATATALSRAEVSAAQPQESQKKRAQLLDASAKKTNFSPWKIFAGRLQRFDPTRGAYDDVSVSTAARLSVVGALGTEVWVGGESGAMFYSNDKGAHWVPVSTGAWSRDATFVGLTPTALRSVEVYLSNGERWRSADGGASWSKYR